MKATAESEIKIDVLRTEKSLCSTLLSMRRNLHGTRQDGWNGWNGWTEKNMRSSAPGNAARSSRFRAHRANVPGVRHHPRRPCERQWEVSHNDETVEMPL